MKTKFEESGFIIRKGEGDIYYVSAPEGGLEVTIHGRISARATARFVAQKIEETKKKAATDSAEKVESIRHSLDRLLEQMKVTREEFVATSPVTITDRPDVKEGFGSEVGSIA